MQKQLYSSYAIETGSLDAAIKLGCKQVRSLSAFYARFHVGFCVFLFAQILSFFLFFPYLSRAAYSPFVLAFFFLTLFSYLTLFFFFQTKKAEQLLSIQEEFAHACKVRYTDHIDLSKAARLAAAVLAKEETSLYSAGTQIKALAPVLEKCKNKLHWEQFFLMKELFFKFSIQELLSFIKTSPLDSDTHAALAEVYIELSLLYLPSSVPFLWTPSAYFSETMVQKFSLASQMAIEEYKILQSNDSSASWIHAKLAEIYRLQENPEKEIEQHEIILSFHPSNPEVLFRLGTLYFAQGSLSKGLEIYANLQQISLAKAEELIKSYDLRHLY